MERIVIRPCDGSPVEVDLGCTVGEALARCDTQPADSPVVAAFVNNEVRALSYRLRINARIQPIALRSSDGHRVYRRSLAYALAIAASRVSPHGRLLVGHSLGNAYYYSFDGGTSPDEVAGLLSRELGAIVAADLPIVRGVVSYDDALEYFRAHHMEDAALLVERHNTSEVAVYRCGEFMDLSHGPLVPRTGLLTTYRIEPYEDGVLLVFPDPQDPTRVTEGSRSHIIFGVYREYKEWGRVLGISSVGQLNQLTERGEVKEFIRVAEALHNKKIAAIADSAAITGEREKVVLIAGPSSSGKTTFTKKLAVQLRAIGLMPEIISLDDYFVSRDRTPVDEDGNFDFEVIEAIDVELLNQHLVALFAGEAVEIPSFNFKTGRPEYRGRTLRLGERSVLMMEGIHGLNPALTPRIAPDRTFRVYVSALTQLNLDDHNRIATTDNRILRRMVRDHQFRGHSAVDTLSMWPSVRRGEDRNIFPFQDSADAVFNTALDYEVGVLRNHAEPLLRQVKPRHDVYHEAVRLQTFLRNFTAIPEKLVPAESILREFIGDSGFHY